MTFQDYAFYFFAALSALFVVYFAVTQIIMPLFRGEAIIPIADFDDPQVRQEIAARVESTIATAEVAATKVRSSTKTSTKAKTATKPSVAKKTQAPKAKAKVASKVATQAPKKTASKPKSKSNKLL